MKTARPSRFSIGMRTAIALLTWVPAGALAATCGDVANPLLLVVTPVAFATYSAVTASNTTANGTITVSCTVQALNTLPGFTVALSAGTTGSFNPRAMAFLSNNLTYNLYTSGAYTTVWGNGTGSTVTQTYNAGSNLAQQSFTVFGSLTKNQYVPAGVYTDSVIVTVTY